MKNRVLALGFFDGVHLGHAALLNKTILRARELDATPAVLTFSSHPGKLTGKESVSLINSPEEREDIIRRLFGIEDIILWDFDLSLMHMPWNSFLNRATAELSVCHFVAGYDYRFGFHGEGNADKLLKFCREHSLGADIINKVSIGGETVSSTLIRSLIRRGDVEQAAAFLGHPHSMLGTVHKGIQLGRTLGIPTVNLHFSPEVLLPAFGVYASKVYIDETSYLGVTNIGVRPTVTDIGVPKAETHILNFSGDLYGKTVRTELLKFLRPERQFLSVDALRTQIRQDICDTISYFSKV